MYQSIVFIIIEFHTNTPTHTSLHITPETKRRRERIRKQARRGGGEEEERKVTEENLLLLLSPCSVLLWGKVKFGKVRKLSAQAPERKGKFGKERRQRKRKMEREERGLFCASPFRERKVWGANFLSSLSPVAPDAPIFFFVCFTFFFY